MSFKDSWFKPPPGIPALGNLVRWGVLAALLLSDGAMAQQVPLPGAEPTISGAARVGYRWRDMSGNEDLYRSLIDLGEGPKLMDFNISYRVRDTTSPRVLDFLDVRSSSWGGEPASTFRTDFGRTGVYRSRVSYRRFNYFNSLPSFANPEVLGIGSSQTSLDVVRGFLDAEMTVEAYDRIEPFLAIHRDSSLGPGRTTFVQEGNEFVVRTLTDNATNTTRGGVRMRFEHWLATIEAGGGRFHDNQTVGFSGANEGNRTALFLGRRLQLDDLAGSYTARGTDRFLRARLEATPGSNVRFFGNFSFSQPSIDLDYSQSNTGTFIVFDAFQFFRSEQSVGQSQASWPHPSGSVGIQYEPTSRWRFQETVWIDRFHVSGSATNQRNVSDGDLLPGPVPFVGGSSRRLESDLTRHRLDVAYELGQGVSLHGSHGFVHAGALSPEGPFQEPEERTYQRHLGSFGVSIKTFDRLDLKADFEIERGTDVFFRTDRRRYGKLRLTGRYRLSDTLTFGLSSLMWNNMNDAPDVRLEQRNRNVSADLMVLPEGGRVIIQAAYTRSTYSSDIPFLTPPNRRTESSAYRDRGHIADLTTLFYPHEKIELRLGGNLFVSTEEDDSGIRARPTRFYETRTEVSALLKQGLSAEFGWSWHEYVNRSFVSEQFRAHLFTAGIEYEF